MKFITANIKRRHFYPTLVRGGRPGGRVRAHTLRLRKFRARTGARAHAHVNVRVHGLVYKWKNHFSEIKEDVGMSLHEKEGNKKNLHQADNPSLHLCS